MLILQNIVIGENDLKESFKVSQPKHVEGIFSAISMGFFFVLVGAIFVATPNLFDKILAFFRNFDIVRVPNTEIFLPGPTSPNAHSVVYLAAGQFSLIWGLFQIAILALRFFAHSPLNKKAETVSNIVFWLGASYLISMSLNEMTTFTTWFAFWATLIALIGVSLIIRAIILAAVRAKLS
jgi:FtsH-binding integral membrane protein